VISDWVLPAATLAWISYFPKRRDDDKVQVGMSLNEILEQLPKLTEDEKRQLRNVLDQELTGEEEESPEFLAELDARVRALGQGARTYSLDEARQTVKDMVARARR
jgi:hypothetical protein